MADILKKPHGDRGSYITRSCSDAKTTWLVLDSMWVLVFPAGSLGFSNTLWNGVVLFRSQEMH